ncbi:MAG: hypothetical protein U9R75_05355 [Candidatus Thermoplasmatota archaeon]|nr:hypothetical protein [Candidatus Thermoplasmatota archaeon]
MRCKRCGIRMQEDEKSSLFRGHTTIYHCSYCNEEIQLRERSSLLPSFFFHSEGGIDQKRAGPIHL